MIERISKVINSIYYYNKPNIFRPNIKELDSRIFFCPKCRSKLSIPRNRIIKIFYICPSCGFEIPKEKVLETKEQVEEYMIENKKRKKDQIVEAILKDVKNGKNAS